MEGLMDLIKGDVVSDAKITKIEILPFKEAYQHPEKIPEDRQVRLADRQFAKVSVDETFSEVHMVPRGLEYSDENGWKIVDRASAAKSLRNRNSWFRSFIERYKTLPTVEMAVEKMLNQNGFFRINLM